MRPSVTLGLLGPGFVTGVICSSHGYSPRIKEIIKKATKDGIDLVSLPFAAAGIATIEAVGKFDIGQYDFSNASYVDVHAHAVPSFYRELVPTTGGFPTPNWSLEDQLKFMIENNVARSILSVSTPGSAVVHGNAQYSAGLARILNEWLAELRRKFPKRFDFYAVIPLPYTEFAIKEAKYALKSLGALGLGLLTNHEGGYLGSPTFRPFYAAINALPEGPHVCMIHPTIPWMKVNGTDVISNPTIYPPGMVEFYFETARALVDLTLSGTLTNFTNIRYHISHVGGSFPSVEDRFLRSRDPVQAAAAKEAYKTQLWYDSAGPTYFAQVKGLLGYDIPKSQLVFGTDYPYSQFPQSLSTQAILDADFLTQAEKSAIFVENAEDMFHTHFH
ncbi:hypothetical protein V8F20_005064 [Naviculisporaceae sp. PSN 640]